MYKHDAENSAASESTEGTCLSFKREEGRNNMTKAEKKNHDGQIAACDGPMKKKAINSINTDAKPSVKKKLNSRIRISKKVSIYL